jgi:hypothetical protein
MSNERWEDVRRLNALMSALNARAYTDNPPTEVELLAATYVEDEVKGFFYALAKERYQVSVSTESTS